MEASKTQQRNGNTRFLQKHLTQIFGERIDKKTVGNLGRILTKMVNENKPLSRNQIMRRTDQLTQLSSSIVYPLISKLEKKGFVEVTGTVKSERGPVPDKLMYSLTFQGQILAGALLSRPYLISRAFDSLPQQDNPIWKFSLSILKETTDSTTFHFLMGENFLRQLFDGLAKGTFDPEAFGKTILIDFNTHLARNSEESSERKAMNELIERKYKGLCEKDQRVVFQYFKFNIESRFLNQLSGDVLTKYLELTRNGEAIHAFCPECRKIIRCGSFPNLDVDHKCSEIGMT
ncbi:MAG: PadR family transcriptional regulator [Candidatus Bathyarchaeia archaeon]|jgi:DNA-binding PadR family transcriptional regulator